MSNLGLRGMNQGYALRFGVLIMVILGWTCLFCIVALTQRVYALERAVQTAECVEVP